MFAGCSLIRGVGDRLVRGGGEGLLLGLGVLRRESRLLLVWTEREIDRLGVERDLLWLRRGRRFRDTECRRAERRGRRLRDAECRRVERLVRLCVDDLRRSDLLVRRCLESGVRERCKLWCWL